MKDTRFYQSHIWAPACGGGIEQKKVRHKKAQSSLPFEDDTFFPPAKNRAFSTRRRQAVRRGVRGTERSGSLQSEVQKYQEGSHGKTMDAFSFGSDASRNSEAQDGRRKDQGMPRGTLAGSGTVPAAYKTRPDPPKARQSDPYRSTGCPSTLAL